MECKLCLRKALKKKWYFDCNCARCQSPDDLGTNISSPKCQECHQGYLLPEIPLDHGSDWSCKNCSKKYNVLFVNELETNAKNKIKEMEKNGET